MEEVLRLLLSGGIVSGAEISERLGVTRAAVWKRVEQLRAAGYQVEAVGRRGYRLLSCPDALHAPLVERGLRTKWAGHPVCYQQSVDSTNLWCKRLAAQDAPHGALALSGTQTAGRGRRGRVWESPEDAGIFMTLLLRPKAHPSQVAQLTLLTALSVAEGIEAATGAQAGIKWPNDVVMNGKKVCGILLEMSADEAQVQYIVAGAGINVHACPADLVKTATCVDEACGRRVLRADLTRAFLESFERRYAMFERSGEQEWIDDYRARSVTLGQRVCVVGADTSFTGTARDVDALGALVVETEDGERRTVLAGDVSVRGVMGYV